MYLSKMIIIFMVAVFGQVALAMDTLIIAQKDTARRAQLGTMSFSQRMQLQQHMLKVSGIKNEIGAQFAVWRREVITEGAASPEILPSGDIKAKSDARMLSIAKLIKKAVNDLAQKITTAQDPAAKNILYQKMLLYNRIVSKLPINNSSTLMQIRKDITAEVERMNIADAFSKELEIFADKLAAMDDREIVMLEFEAWKRDPQYIALSTAQAQWYYLAKKALDANLSIVNPNIFSLDPEQSAMSTQYARQGLQLNRTGVNESDLKNQKLIQQLEFRGKF